MRDASREWRNWRIGRLFLAAGWCGLVLALLAAAPVRAEVEQAAARTLVIGGDRNYPPYEYLDENGDPSGFNVDLSRAVGEAMGIEVRFELMDWTLLHEALAQGRVDALQRTPYSNLWLREADMTPPHTTINHAIFARAETPAASSLEELADKKVIVHPGGSVYDILNGLGFEKDLVFSRTPVEGLRRLASGVGDYAVVAMLPGVIAMKQEHLDNLRVVAKSVTTQPYGFAVRRGDDATLALLDEGLALVKRSGRYKKLRAKWFGVMDAEALSVGMVLKYAAVVLGPLLLLLGGAALWTRSLKKQVDQRTRSLSEALRELQENQQKLVQADKMAALGVLVAGVAHEINNPNGLILLNLPILKKVNAEATRVLDEVYREKGDFPLGGGAYSRIRDRLPRIVEVIEESARRIRRIVDDLRDFSRADPAVEKESFNLNDVVAKAARLMGATIRHTTSRFELRLAPDLPPLCGSPQRIEQVAVNLLLNACQALPDIDKGIVVTTSHDMSAGAVVLTVADEGVGIAAEDLPRLTDPFFTTKRASGGTGLGLSVSAGIVEEHGGTLHFASEPGRGTTATLTLPLPREAAA